MRVVVADPGEIWLRGFTPLLNQILPKGSQVELVSALGDVLARLDSLTDADLLLTELSISGQHGDAAETLMEYSSEFAPGLNFGVLTTEFRSGVLRQLMTTPRLRGKAYIDKSDPAERILAGINAARAGTHFLSRRFEAMERERNSKNVRGMLTRRQPEAMDLVASGLTNEAIAATLGVDKKTVEGILRGAFRRLVPEETDQKRFNRRVIAAVRWRELSHLSNYLGVGP